MFIQKLVHPNASRVIFRRVPGEFEDSIEIRIFDASEETGVEVEFSEYEFKRFRDGLNKVKVE